MSRVLPLAVAAELERVLQPKSGVDSEAAHSGPVPWHWHST